MPVKKTEKIMAGLQMKYRSVTGNLYYLLKTFGKENCFFFLSQAFKEARFLLQKYKFDFTEAECYLNLTFE